MRGGDPVSRTLLCVIVASVLGATTGCALLRGPADNERQTSIVPIGIQELETKDWSTFAVSQSMLYEDSPSWLEVPFDAGTLVGLATQSTAVAGGKVAADTLTNLGKTYRPRNVGQTVIATKRPIRRLIIQFAGNGKYPHTGDQQGQYGTWIEGWFAEGYRTDGDMEPGDTADLPEPTTVVPDPSPVAPVPPDVNPPP